MSKKVGKAVVRNRVRRRLREAMRELVASAPVRPEALSGGVPSFDAVIVARPEAAKVDYATLRQALILALKRSKVMV